MKFEITLPKNDYLSPDPGNLVGLPANYLSIVKSIARADPYN
jgi:hypothetical protein